MPPVARLVDAFEELLDSFAEDYPPAEAVARFMEVAKTMDLTQQEKDLMLDYLKHVCDRVHTESRKGMH